MSDSTVPEIYGWTLERHILEQQRHVAGASGEFTKLFQQLALAGKIIGSRVNQAGLADVLGVTGDVNVQGEEVQKLDVFANHALIRCLEAGGQVCLLASEEVDDPIPIPTRFPLGKYVLMFDPLDGSSNIDVNISIGTIFSVHERLSGATEKPGLRDCLQPGHKQVAAGYIIYGSSTMFVYTTGKAVHGFTLDPTVGEFFLSHPNIRLPERGKIYSVNEGNSAKWDDRVRSWVDAMKQEGSGPGRPYSSRYIGTLVADFHRTLLKGGIFAYPADNRNPEGKLRLLYEASPMAMIAEAAGGAATTGHERILDLQPRELHQRVPLYIGSKLDVEDLERALG
ncbi:MAG: class 1 fructose-bisphosphatase [Myxococcales bacterium]|nr:class 1 fructose-bisphosphatase [Myxococcales bacterium]